MLKTRESPDPPLCPLGQSKKAIRPRRSPTLGPCIATLGVDESSKSELVASENHWRRHNSEMDPQEEKNRVSASHAKDNGLTA